MYHKSLAGKIFRLAVYLPALMFVACSANSQIYDQSGSINTLSVNLGDTFRKNIENNVVELSYCPDNTCLVFSGTLENEIELADFSLLYLFHASAYVYLVRDMHGKGVFVNNVRKEAESLLSEYNDGCKGDELDMISCSLKNLYGHTDFVVYGTRFDEGSVHKIQMNIKESLDKMNLISVGTYRERFIRK